jgi:hypothetical protein
MRGSVISAVNSAAPVALVAPTNALLIQLIGKVPLEI